MREPLWLAEDAARATGGRLTGKDSWLAAGVSIDTRTLEPGDLFVALKDVRDGHEFVQAAFARGASAALISNKDAATHGPCLLVPDVLQALADLADAARTRSQARRIAITGSVGKTSTKEALALCLAASGATHASVLSYNNHWGVPLTLARMPRSTQFAAFECGMNHRHEILPLSQLVRPHVAIVTWIAPAHIENLGSLEAIAEEKADIYAGLENEGVAIVPNEAPHASTLINNAERGASHIVRFGREQGCEARLLSFEPVEGGAIAQADILGRQLRYRIGAEGAHWALNSLAALAAAEVAGADLKAAAHSLADLRPLAGRGRAHTIAAAAGTITLIDDAYNANPASMAAAFETLANRPATAPFRKIAALGDMLELGQDSAAYHAGLAAPIEAAGLDLVFCAGPMMRALYEQLPGSRRGGYAESSTALVPLLQAALRDGDIILIKGSNGSQMGRVVDALMQSSKA
ncbi:MAG: UDP-N-acetylmuramoyl-tripeptide--D-alanyl-D-alanine ligase [Caulobacterales bacterium]